MKEETRIEDIVKNVIFKVFVKHLKYSEHLCYNRLHYFYKGNNDIDIKAGQSLASVSRPLSVQPQHIFKSKLGCIHRKFSNFYNWIPLIIADVVNISF